MQQRGFRRPIGAIDGHGAALAQHGRDLRGSERIAGDQRSPGTLAPDMGEMGFSRAGRSMPSQRREAPLPPALDPGEGRGIGFGSKEIGSSVNSAPTEIEGQL